MPRELYQRRVLDIASGKVKLDGGEPKVWFNSIKMKIDQIQNSDDLKLALLRIEELWDSKDPQGVGELDSLATLISDYEDKLIHQKRKDQPDITVD